MYRRSVPSFIQNLRITVSSTNTRSVRAIPLKSSPLNLSIGVAVGGVKKRRERSRTQKPGKACFHSTIPLISELASFHNLPLQENTSLCPSVLTRPSDPTVESTVQLDLV